MKYYSRLKKYKCSNLEYDIQSEIAYSYEWYQIAKRINGTMVLNSYSYSPSTLRHFYKIRNLFDSLNITYIMIEAPKGLQCLDSAKDRYEEQIKSLQKAMSKPRSHAGKNQERKAHIYNLTYELLVIKGLRV